MTGTIQISCKDLGVDHDGTVTGNSLDDLVACASGMLQDQGVTPETPEASRLLKAAIRNALVQASRPVRFRSSNLSEVIAAIA